MTIILVAPLFCQLYYISLECHASHDTTGSTFIFGFTADFISFVKAANIDDSVTALPDRPVLK